MNTGLQSYSIANDVITSQNLLSIAIDLRKVQFYGSGSYVAVVSNSQSLVVLASLSGTTIISNFNYYIEEASSCTELGIVNDYDAYLACSGGVYRYRLSAYSMLYIEQAYSSGTVTLNGIAFFPNEARFGFMMDGASGKFLFFDNGNVGNFVLSTPNYLTVTDSSAYDLVFFKTTTAFITAMSGTSNSLEFWTYCPYGCVSCTASNTCSGGCIPQRYDSGSGNCSNWCPAAQPQCTSATSGVLATTSAFTGLHLGCAYQPGTNYLFVTTNSSGTLNVYDLSSDTFTVAY